MSSYTIDQLNWYVLYTKPRFEKKIYHTLQEYGYKVFLPLVKEKRVWSDRIKTVIVPLLPNYVFVKIPKNKCYRIFDCPGVVRFVSSGGKPCIIDEQEITYLENIVTHGFAARSFSNFGIGEKVRVIRGPLKGWKGRLASKRGNGRVLFQIESIRQAICVEVHASDIAKIN